MMPTISFLSRRTFQSFGIRALGVGCFLAVPSAAFAQQQGTGEPLGTTGNSPTGASGASGGTQGVAGTGAGATTGDPAKATGGASKDGAVTDEDKQRAAGMGTGSAGAKDVGLPPPMPNVSNFMDTRLTWTFGDDDFLNKTGELLPLSPTFSVGDRGQYRLFFDNLNSRFAGRENITHLVMYKKMPGFIDKLTTEASLVLRLDLAALSANTNNANTAFYDSGSYLRLFYQTGASEKQGLSVIFFPLDTDRFRVGYLYDISWGGTAGYINQSIFPRIQGSSPGAKIQYDSEKFYAFAGFKTATIVQPEQILTNSAGGSSEVEVVRVGETNFGVLGGLGFDPLKNLRFDVSGGFFQQGKFDLEDVRGKSVSTAGTSARLVLHDNMPVPQSVDFRLYRNDPMAPQILFAQEKYKPGDVSWSASVEGSYLSQQLKDFDNAGVVKAQGAFAVAAQATVKASYLRMSLTGIMRDLNFVVRNVPGFIPFETLPANAKSDNELFVAAAADYYIESARLTPGIGGGVQLPATFRSEFQEGGLPASRTVVVRQQGDNSILPYNETRSAIIQARVSLKWDLSTLLSALVWGQYVHDGNGTLVVRDQSEGTASLRVSQKADRLGLGVSMQARF